MFSSFSDEELIGHYQKTGDQSYAGELFKRYHHLVFFSCGKYIEGEEECQDATMHIFEKMLSALPNAQVQSFSNWLAGIIRNECLTIIGKSRPQTLPIKEHILSSNEEIQEWHYYGSKESTVEYDQITISRAIDQLQPEQQDCLELFYMEEKSYGEIAGMTSYSLNQVKSHLQNGKRRLRKLLISTNAKNI